MSERTQPRRAAAPGHLTEIKVDASHLYREEVFTDLRIATIRRLTPGARGRHSRPVAPRRSTPAQTTLMSQAGPLPVEAPIERRVAQEAAREVPAPRSRRRSTGCSRRRARSAGARRRGSWCPRRMPPPPRRQRARRQDHPLNGAARRRVGERAGSRVGALRSPPRDARAALALAHWRRRRACATRFMEAVERAARRRGHRRVPLPVPVHGSRAPRARSARRAHRDGARGDRSRRGARPGCRCSRAASRSAAA